MSNVVALVRAGYGTTLLAAPDRVLSLFGGDPASAAQRTVARILGARHVAQALVTRGGRFTRLGAAVDAIHAASMLGLAALSEEHRRPALIDGSIATTFALSAKLA